MAMSRPSTSYEPSRTKAYDSDLRWRMIYQLTVQNYSLQEVSKNLGVSLSTVCRVRKLFDTTGSVDKQKYPVRLLGKSLTTYDEFAILELVLQRPGIYLHEICRELLDTTGTDTSVANNNLQVLEKMWLHSY